MPRLLQGTRETDASLGRRAPSAVRLRLHGELRDLPGPRRRGGITVIPAPGHATVKDLLESRGVPHTEVSAVTADGRTVDGSYRPQGGERLAAFPWRWRGRGPRSAGRRGAPRRLRFVLDVHLGTLARWLRLMGFDALYRRDYRDDEIAAAAEKESRVVLTRDTGLLKHKRIRYGRWLRATAPEDQWREVGRRYLAGRRARPLSRCPACNGTLRCEDTREAVKHVPPETARNVTRFMRCRACGRFYWRGAHAPGLRRRLKRLLARGGLAGKTLPG